jgi:adenosylcobinamide kinase / adenosylcobinamide-phosphate guanylyltransferase
MRVTVLGTGAADGWPNPFCVCASCTQERRQGRARAQTSALVDDALLLDCGPEAPRQAARAGVALDRLTAVLVTHLHPDHFDPSFLLYRGWVRREPLRLVGTPAVLDAAAAWLGPDSAVTLTPMSAGDVAEVAGYRVRALEARHEAPGGALVYDVTAADGDRLLYATDVGPKVVEDLAATAPGPAYSVVLLEETFGDHTGHGTDHLDLTTFPAALRALRSTGAVDERTDVVAVHLSHRNPPTHELARRLEAYGARVVDDGTTLTAPATAPPEMAPALPRRTLVTGGARSGKSREAERMLLAEPEVVYVATGSGPADDTAWQRRVDQHRGRRPAHWRTVETLDLPALLREPGPPLLVDCLTLWLAGVLDRGEAWSEDRDDAEVDALVGAETSDLLSAWRETPRRVVAVTNEVGSGVVPGTVSGGRFRDLLGRLNAEVAAECERVVLCVAGRAVVL